MLKDFDNKTLHAAARLLGNSDHQTLIAWLDKESTRIAREGMDLQNIETVRWYQGGYQFLDALIDNLKTARDVAEAKRKDLTGGPKAELI